MNETPPLRIDRARGPVLRLALVLVPALAIGPMLTGCGQSARRTYYAQNATNVWQAAKAAAESPTYNDWHVVENHVQPYPGAQRVEVVRDLRRTLHRPGAKPWNERRTWQFGVELVEVRPPTIEFRSRGSALPTHFQIERDRFFADVDLILAVPGAARDQMDGRPMTIEPGPAPVTAPARPRDAQPVTTPERMAEPVGGDLLDPAPRGRPASEPRTEPEPAPRSTRPVAPRSGTLPPPPPLPRDLPDEPQ